MISSSSLSPSFEDEEPVLPRDEEPVLPRDEVLFAEKSRKLLLLTMTQRSVLLHRGWSRSSTYVWTVTGTGAAKVTAAHNARRSRSGVILVSNEKMRTEKNKNFIKNCMYDTLRNHDRQLRQNHLFSVGF